MSEASAIEWTDSTVNFWWGCTKVGPPCDFCYAETWARRLGFDIWGTGVPRRLIKGAEKLILKLQNDSSWFYADHDRDRRVFIQSMSDLFDVEVPIEWFAEGWRLIKLCSDLAIQIVTKRVSVIEKRLAAIGETAWPKHAGLIITVASQAEADRDIPRLLALKAKFGIPWVGLSMEPLLGPVDLDCWPSTGCPTGWLEELDWVIVGYESGANARARSGDLARSLRDQCAGAGVPFLFKQHGEWIDVRDLRNLEGGAGPGFGRFDHCKHDIESDTVRVGKKAAGRLLDGVQHDGFPA